MGFSGGGSNVLLPHTHDGTVAQDGGSLDFDNVTQADLTAGDVVFSDGTHLQRLAIGTPAQQIQVNAGATAPEYFTPAVAASAFKLEGSDTSTNATTHALTVTPAVALDETSAEIYITINGSMLAAQDMVFRINGLTDATYNKANASSESQAAFAFGLSTNATSFKLTNQKGADWFTGQVHMSITEDSSGTMQALGNYYIVNTGTETANLWQGVIYKPSISSLTEFKLSCGTTTSNYFGNGTTMSVYSLSKT